MYYFSFLDTEKSWFNWIVPNLLCGLVNLVVVIAILARIMIFGEPVTKPLSESSVCYWRNRKQADLDLVKVQTSILTNIL